jgi:hypothetical protein
VDALLHPDRQSGSVSVRTLTAVIAEAGIDPNGGLQSTDLSRISPPTADAVECQKRIHNRWAGLRASLRITVAGAVATPGHTTGLKYVLQVSLASLLY